METVRWMQDLDRRYREHTGLGIESYKIFYSLIKPAPLLILGINPGGSPAAFSREVREFYPSLWVRRILENNFWFENGEHEYADCNYPIARVMNRFLQQVTELDSGGVRGIPKTNMVFRRSPSVDEFQVIHRKSLEEAEAESRPFVQEILCRVSPQVILLEGMKALDLFQSAHGVGPAVQLLEPVMAEYRGRSVRFCVAASIGVKALNRPVKVIAIGHPSTFGRLAGFEAATAAAKRVYLGRETGVQPRTMAAHPNPVAPSGRSRVVGTSRSDLGHSPAPEHPAGLDPDNTHMSGPERPVSGRGSLAGLNRSESSKVESGPDLSVAGNIILLGHGCEVRTLPSGKINRLEIWRGTHFLGEYERSNDREVARKIGEIRSALTQLLDAYQKHGPFKVRWDGKARRKVVRGAGGEEIAVIAREHWGRPSWER
jgi:hypothetical protein